MYMNLISYILSLTRCSAADLVNPEDEDGVIGLFT